MIHRSNMADAFSAPLCSSLSGVEGLANGMAPRMPNTAQRPSQRRMRVAVDQVLRGWSYRIRDA